MVIPSAGAQSERPGESPGASSEWRYSEDLSFRSQTHKSDIVAAERLFLCVPALTRFALNASRQRLFSACANFILPERRTMTTITEERSASTEVRQKETATLVSGVVDADDRRGYLRTAGYRRSSGDIPLTNGQLRQFGLRKGDLIEGTGRPGKTLVSVETVNGLPAAEARSEEHTSELQSRRDLVCRLLLEKKK